MGIIPMSNVASGANWQKKSKAGVESHRAKTSQRKHVRECGFGPTVFLPETETNAVTDRFLGSYEVVAVCLLLFTTVYGLRPTVGTSVQEKSIRIFTQFAYIIERKSSDKGKLNHTKAKHYFITWMRYKRIQTSLQTFTGGSRG